MTENSTYEVVGALPLLLGLAIKLDLPQILDRCLGTHGLHQGLSNGWLATVWLAYLLCQADHSKVKVEEWVWQHRLTLQHLIGQPLRQVDFSDDRLSIVLHRLADQTKWYSLEAALWSATCQVYQVEVESVRLDSTTSYGYHTVTENTLMQLGHSKDHRPDLPQLKLMAAAAQPANQLIACEVWPGQSADDPLYLPLIERVRQIVGQKGLLYVGDSKMAALPCRAALVAGADFYLTPLPQTGKSGELLAQGVAAAVNEPALLTPIVKGHTLLGYGYEFSRDLDATVAGKAVVWQERVQVVRSLALAESQAKSLDERLVKAVAAIKRLTPAPGRGRRQYCDEAGLTQAIAAQIKRYQVTDLLEVEFTCERQTHQHYVGRGRGSPNRPVATTTSLRYVITKVELAEAAIADAKARLGWRVQVTNLSLENFSLSKCVLIYREGWGLERQFHLMKDKPLGIRPLYVRRDDQIRGLTHLVTLALRLMTLLEMQVRREAEREGAPLEGLYQGQPRRKTSRPSGRQILGAFIRAQIILSCGSGGEVHLTPLPPTLSRIVAYLGLPPSLYNDLLNNSS